MSSFCSHISQHKRTQTITKIQDTNKVAHFNNKQKSIFTAIIINLLKIDKCKRLV